MIGDIATPYTACYAILNKDNKIFFLLRSNTTWMDNHYGLAAGRVEKGETFIEGTIREAKEEAGIDITPENLNHKLTIHRLSDDGNTWVDVFFEVSDWSGEPYNAEPHLHSKMEWLDPKNLPDNVIPMVKFALEQIEARKNYAEYGWGIK